MPYPAHCPCPPSLPTILPTVLLTVPAHPPFLVTPQLLPNLTLTQTLPSPRDEEIDSSLPLIRRDPTHALLWPPSPKFVISRIAITSRKVRGKNIPLAESLGHLIALYLLFLPGSSRSPCLSLGKKI
ncbi:hypothetical protein E2C01_056074 [Portunus trituberculatus]|uniref:Uncharacterized protein n=1 Tax=Portunus trituberculatus TaxID=210409 RepID=A0A5B7GX80_PORTR|nr:hypothetical protein [Portunus trituberculatus]